jgi:hypothetical protein
LKQARTETQSRRIGYKIWMEWKNPRQTEGFAADFDRRLAELSAAAVLTSAAFRFSSSLLPFVVPSAASAVLLLPPPSVDGEEAVVASVWPALVERYAPPAANSPAEDSSLVEAALAARLVSRWRPVAPVSRVWLLALDEADCSGVPPVAGWEPVEYAPTEEYSPESVAAEHSIDPLKLAALVPARMVEPVDCLPADCLPAGCWR